MVHKRLKMLGYDPLTTNFRQRSKFLRGFEGWYDLPKYSFSLENFHSFLQFVNGEIAESEMTVLSGVDYLELNETGLVNGVRVGKWIRDVFYRSKSKDNKKSILFNVHLSNFIEKNIVGGRVKFSCKYNDILRMSSTNHFNSCFAPEGIHCEIPVKQLENPNLAVIFKLDSSGKILSRVLVLHFLNNKGVDCLGFFGLYGDGFKMDYLINSFVKFLGVEIYNLTCGKVKIGTLAKKVDVKNLTFLGCTLHFDDSRKVLFVFTNSG